MTNISQITLAKSLIPRYLLVLIFSALAGLLFYQEPIATVLAQVVNRSDSSHGVFVPIIAAYFLWLNKGRIKETTVDYFWPGIPLLIVCLVLAAAKIGSHQVQFIAFIVFTCGLVLVLLGKAVFKPMAFPILFLISMTPLPPDLYSSLANFSRTIAFGGSLEIISWLGIPYLRVGWDVELPNAMLRVAESCSGIRYLISFVVFGMAYAYLHKATAFGRIATLLATILISLFASICRLTIIFVMTYWVSPFWSQHGPHVVLSWLVFFTVLFSSIFIDQWIQKRRQERGAGGS